MRQTLEALWNGNLAPAHQCGRDDPQISKTVTYMARHEDALNRVLTPQQKEIFEKYTDCTEEYTLLVAEQAFCDGFCLASKLLAEALAPG